MIHFQDQHALCVKDCLGLTRQMCTCNQPRQKLLLDALIGQRRLKVRMSTILCLLSTVYCLLSTVYYLLSTVYCLLFTVYCLLSTVYCLLSFVYCLLSPAYFLLYIVYWHHLISILNIHPCARPDQPIIPNLKQWSPLQYFWPAQIKRPPFRDGLITSNIVTNIVNYSAILLTILQAILNQVLPPSFPVSPSVVFLAGKTARQPYLSALLPTGPPPRVAPL